MGGNRGKDYGGEWPAMGLLLAGHGRRVPTQTQRGVPRNLAATRLSGSGHSHDRLSHDTTVFQASLPETVDMRVHHEPLDDAEFHCLA